MTPNQRAHQAVRSYLDIGSTLSLGEWIAKAIRQAEQDAYKSVLSIVEQHQQHDSCVFLDELEDQIKQAMTDP
jgi:hypothetical protein